MVNTLTITDRVIFNLGKSAVAAVTLGIILRDFLVAILRGSAKYRRCPGWLRFPSPLAKARFSASSFCELTSRTAGRSPRLLAKPRSLIERSSIGWSAIGLPGWPRSRVSRGSTAVADASFARWK